MAAVDVSTAEMDVSDFTIDLYQKVCNTDGNVVISPYSIASAMMLTALGCAGTTEDQILSSLRLNDVKEVHKSYGSLQDDLQSGPTMSNANKIFSKHGFQVKDTFLQRCKQYYKSTTEAALWCAGIKDNNLLSSLRLNDVKEAHKSYGSLQDGLQSGPTMSIANRIYPKLGLKLKDTFLQRCKEYYKSTIEALDYASDPEGSRKTINQWVEEQTNEKIKDLIPEGAINGMTVNVLANAIYFKGLWEKQFPKDKTGEGDFYVTPEEKRRVQMMEPEIESKFRCAQNNKYKCKIIELPYKEELLSMFIVLPHDGGKLSNIEGQLSSSMLNELKSEMFFLKVDLKLPKFKIESSFDLKQTLIEMGMEDIFSPQKADMSAMFDLTGAEPNKPFVSDVVHKAFVEVNEEGTEAAAATAVIMMDCCRMDNFKFIANRPFLYFIQNNKTGIILFIGKLCKPEA